MRRVEVPDDTESLAYAARMVEEEWGWRTTSEASALDPRSTDQFVWLDFDSDRPPRHFPASDVLRLWPREALERLSDPNDQEYVRAWLS